MARTKASEIQGISPRSAWATLSGPAMERTMDTECSLVGRRSALPAPKGTMPLASMASASISSPAMVVGVQTCSSMRVLL
jgi:hypothetical protein